ncbi:hypothetical protein [Aquabacter spiritensis]|uniref:Uncharacterized protein n=1 Tax=Aquabacter spiritensis TaxID=933073 RepID=A0A4R3M1J3_9HYPH|nr:hypothetical protein [Aquabacter spiritensis]TCT06862.1 hypothetical protein EDC64_102343 [Aquabacter spiritensis]
MSALLMSAVLIVPAALALVAITRLLAPQPKPVPVRVRPKRPRG